MSGISDVRGTLETLDTRQAALDAAEADLVTADAAVDALITTEAAALEAATTTFNAARDAARATTGWQAVFDARQDALAARQSAHSDFQIAVEQWEPGIL